MALSCYLNTISIGYKEIKSVIQNPKVAEPDGLKNMKRLPSPCKIDCLSFCRCVFLVSITVEENGYPSPDQGVHLHSKPYILSAVGLSPDISIQVVIPCPLPSQYSDTTNWHTCLE